MINPVTLGLVKEDGMKFYVLVEPMLEKTEHGLTGTGIFKLYKDAVGDESALFTEPLEIAEGAAALADAANPDYLGTITLNGNNFTYQGDLLTPTQQKQVAAYITNYK